MTALPIHKELTVLLQKLINHKENSPTWEPYIIHRILWNPKVHYRVHNSPPLYSIISQINLVHVLATDFLRYILILFSHLCLGLPRGNFSSSFPSKILYAPLLYPIRDTSPARLIINIIIINIVIFSESSCVSHTILIKLSNLVLSKASPFAFFRLHPASAGGQNCIIQHLVRHAL